MICPTCNIQMNHLNVGGGFSGTDAYQTYDYVECPKCKKRAIEFYHTEFMDEVRTPTITFETITDMPKREPTMSMGPGFPDAGMIIKY